jgi:hypothetical protein
VCNIALQRKRSNVPMCAIANGRKSTHCVGVRENTLSYITAACRHTA